MSLKKDFYADLAKTLISSIGTRTYHTSIIAGGDFDFKFSIVIYRDNNNKITDIVPVWYMFKKYPEDDFEFDFDKLVEAVKNL